MGDKENSNAALETYLLPFKEIFNQENVAEISVNKPGEVWIEQAGSIRKESIPSVTKDHLNGLAVLIATFTEQKIGEEMPLLSATLPNGFRVQIVIPPATEIGQFGLSIRKPSLMNLNLDKYEEMGLFKSIKIKEEKNEFNEELISLLKEKKIKEFLRKSVIYKKNIIISGGTSTGKTTFANAILQEIPLDERVITCEDAREIQLIQENTLHLLASKGGQGRAKVQIQDLIEACLRLRPDRIIVGELRGAEAFSFLRAINTGHPGSISTLHADTPQMAIEQLKMMVMQAGLGMESEDIKNYIKNVVDIIVQLKRGGSGVRFISEIYFNKI